MSEVAEATKEDKSTVPNEESSEVKTPDTSEEAAAESPVEELQMFCEEVPFETLGVGDVVRCWCGRCKDFRQHNVKALNPDGKPPSSVCITCKAVHRVRYYRPGAKKKAAKKPPAPVINPWIALCEGVLADDCTDYAIAGTYVREEFISHSVFGIGKISEIIGPTKVRVTFEAGSKILLQNR